MMYAGDTDAADTCAVSPYSVDEGASARAVLTPPEHVLNVCLYCYNGLIITIIIILALQRGNVVFFHNTMVTE